MTARPDTTEIVLVWHMTVESTFHKACTYVKIPERIKNTGKTYTEYPSYCIYSLKKKKPGTGVPINMMIENSNKTS